MKDLIAEPDLGTSASFLRIFIVYAEYYVDSIQIFRREMVPRPLEIQLNFTTDPASFRPRRRGRSRQRMYLEDLKKDVM